MTDTYHVAMDHDGDEALWRGEPGADDVQCVVYRYLLDGQDPVLWPTLVAALCARTPEETAALEAEVREEYRFNGVIPAIRHYRKLTNAGLREARLAVERICADTERVS